MFIIDCRSMSCPQPIVQCKTQLEIERLDAFTVIVDNIVAVDNVRRFLQKQGYSVTDTQISSNQWDLVACLLGTQTYKDKKEYDSSSELKEQRYYSNSSLASSDGKASFLRRKSDPLEKLSPKKISLNSPVQTVEQSLESEAKIVVYITSEVIGNGHDELGVKLMESFLSTLASMSVWHVVLLHKAVLLTTEEGNNLSSLQRLEKDGVKILVCGACLNHYGVFEQMKVGETTNMLDIISVLELADKVIRP